MINNFIVYMSFVIIWKSIKDFFSAKTIGRLIGSNIFATSFFLGYLPEWSRHWSAFLSILVSIVLLYNIVSIPLQQLDLAYALMLEFVYSFLVANFMVPIFRKTFPLAKIDNVTIDAFIAQVLVLAMCVPAIFHINAYTVSFTRMVCTSFLNCTPFVFDIITLIVTLLGPYFVLRFFDKMEFWPTSKIFLYSESSFIRIFGGICPAFYSIVIIYLISFLLFDLTLMQVIEFYTIVFNKIYNHFIFVIIVISKTFSSKGFYLFLKKIGLIKLLDKYGFINMEYYDLKYLEKSRV